MTKLLSIVALVRSTAGLNSDQGYSDNKKKHSLRRVITHAKVQMKMIHCTSSQKRMFSKIGCSGSSSFALWHDISTCTGWHCHIFLPVQYQGVHNQSTWNELKILANTSPWHKQYQHVKTYYIFFFRRAQL